MRGPEIPGMGVGRGELVGGEDWNFPDASDSPSDSPFIPENHPSHQQQQQQQQQWNENGSHV